MSIEFRSKILMVAALAAVSTACAEPKASAEPVTEVSAAKAGPGVLDVKTAEVTEAEVPLQLRLTGSLKGEQDTQLSANASGQVVRTYVERGDTVKAGQIIAKLDTSAASLNLAEASLQVERSATEENIVSADCARYEKLKDKGAISAMEYDQATAKCKTAPLSLQVAKTRAQLAKKTVSDGVIRAPFAGTVTERFVSVGEYVQPATRVASIVRNEQLRLEFGVPEANLAHLEEGAQVTFSVAAYPEREFTATVRYLAGAVRPATRDMLVEAVVSEQSDARLRPGMFADVRLQVGSEKLPTVPQAAIKELASRKHVFVVHEGKLEERVLQPGPALGDRLSVQDGVAAGELVAVGDLGKLKNGAAVR